MERENSLQTSSQKPRQIGLVYVLIGLSIIAIEKTLNAPVCILSFIVEGIVTYKHVN